MIVSPSDLAGPPKRAAGGDKNIPRDSKDRPRIKVTCSECAGAGVVPSQKVEGRLNKCGKCSGDGEYLRSYTRTTTYIDVLSDKKFLQAWGERNVLIGVAMDPKFLNDVLDLTDDLESGDEDRVKKAKDALNRKAERAKDKAGANLKSEHGTYKHDLAELLDEGKPLPTGVTATDLADLEAYRAAKSGLFVPVHAERLMVNDALKVAGTPDRLETLVPGEVLIAPDGEVIGGDDLIVTDLKTGSLYDPLKMAMQLSIYANSSLYDPKDGSRLLLPTLRRDWGVISHLPAGSAKCDLYWADLRLGWEAVQVAGEVRRMRRVGKNALTLFA